jgi:hypothetical protein
MLTRLLLLKRRCYGTFSDDLDEIAIYPALRRIRITA